MELYVLPDKLHIMQQEFLRLRNEYQEILNEYRCLRIRDDLEIDGAYAIERYMSLVDADIDEEIRVLHYCAAFLEHCANVYLWQERLMIEHQEPLVSRLYDFSQGFSHEMYPHMDRAYRGLSLYRKALPWKRLPSLAYHKLPGTSSLIWFSRIPLRLPNRPAKARRWREPMPDRLVSYLQESYSSGYSSMILLTGTGLIPYFYFLYYLGLLPYSHNYTGIRSGYTNGGYGSAGLGGGGYGGGKYGVGGDGREKNGSGRNDGDNNKSLADLIGGMGRNTGLDNITSWLASNYETGLAVTLSYYYFRWIYRIGYLQYAQVSDKSMLDKEEIAKGQDGSDEQSRFEEKKATEKHGLGVKDDAVTNASEINNISGNQLDQTLSFIESTEYLRHQAGAVSSEGKAHSDMYGNDSAGYETSDKRGADSAEHGADLTRRGADTARYRTAYAGNGAASVTFGSASALYGTADGQGIQAGTGYESYKSSQDNINLFDSKTGDAAYDMPDDLDQAFGSSSGNPQHDVSGNAADLIGGGTTDSQDPYRAPTSDKPDFINTGYGTPTFDESISSGVNNTYSGAAGSFSSANPSVSEINRGDAINHNGAMSGTDRFSDNYPYHGNSDIGAEISASSPIANPRSYHPPGESVFNWAIQQSVGRAAVSRTGISRSVSSFLYPNEMFGDGPAPVDYSQDMKIDPHRAAYAAFFAASVIAVPPLALAGQSAGRHGIKSANALCIDHNIMELLGNVKRQYMAWMSTLKPLFLEVL